MELQCIRPAVLLPTAPGLFDDLEIVAEERCTWCGGTDRSRFTRAFQDAPWPSPDWWHCSSCGFWISASPTLGDQVVADQPYVYARRYRPRLRRKMRTSRHRFRVVEAMAGAQGRFLDIGCSYGTMLRAGEERGWQTVGVDISQAVVQAARQAGLHAQVGHLTELPVGDRVFDVVWARHVLEHDVRTYTALREMARVAKPGALVMIETPDAASRPHRQSPAVLAGQRLHWTAWHRVLFTPEVLAGFCTRLGWQQVLEPAAVPGPLGFQAWRTFKLWTEQTRRASRIVTWWRTPGEETSVNGFCG